MAIAPVKKPAPPALKPAPSSSPKAAPFVDALAQRLALKAIDIVAMLDDPAILELIATAIESHDGSTPDLADPVEAQLARNFVGSSKRRLLSRALDSHRATKAAKGSRR